MKYLLGAGKGIVFFVVTYLFAYGAATLYAQPYQATFIGWASYKGQTLLLKPGIIAAIKYKGEEFLLNAPANAVMKFEMGVSLALVALVGATAGLVWAAKVPPPPPLKDEGSPATSALPAMALILALVGGLGGPVPAYAAFLTGTWAIRTGLSRRERIAATAGQALGAILVAVWGAGLAMTFRSEAI